MRNTLAFAAAFAAFLMSPLARGDTLLGADWQRWHEFKPGAFAKTVTTSTATPDIVVENVTRIVNASDVEVNLEETSTAVVGGQRITGNTEPHIVVQGEHEGDAAPAKIDPKSLPGATEGVEVVAVAGKKVSAHWIKFALNPRPGCRTTQTWWMSDEVPGGLVKLVTTTEETAADKTQSTTVVTLALVDFSNGK